MKKCKAAREHTHKEKVKARLFLKYKVSNNIKKLGSTKQNKSNEKKKTRR